MSVKDIEMHSRTIIQIDDLHFVYVTPFEYSDGAYAVKIHLHDIRKNRFPHSSDRFLGDFRYWKIDDCGYNIRTSVGILKTSSGITFYAKLMNELSNFYNMSELKIKEIIDVFNRTLHETVEKAK